MEDISKITKEEKESKIPFKISNEKYDLTGSRFMIDLGYWAGGYKGPELYFTYGSQINQYLFVGVYNDDTGVMTVYYNEGKKKSPDPFTYSFDKNTMRLAIVFDSDPEPPIVYDVKASEGWPKLDCISGDFEDFSMYKIK